MTALPLGDIPTYHARRRGHDQCCLRHGDAVLTWGELDDRATRRAHALAAQGVGQDDLVVLAVPNSNALFELTFAIWKLGATPAIVSAALPPAELAAILDLAQPRAYVAEGRAAEARAGSLPFAFGSDHGDGRAIASAIAKHWKVMTSGGSTGRPKLIVDQLPAAMDPGEDLMRLPADRTIFNPGPCYHNMPFATSCRALIRGNAVVGTERFDALETLRSIERHGVEWTHFVPTMMHRIWNLPEAVRHSFDLSSLRTVWHTAAPVPAWLKRCWIDWLGPDRIFEMYGGTEGVGATALSGSEWLAHPGSVGRPVYGDVAVLDAEGRPVPSGEIGEIFFWPPAAFASGSFAYIGAEARRGPEQSISLGDNGWLDAEGFLYLAGRRTDLILSGGANIYPAEIESVLSACEKVEGVAVIGLPDEDLGERVHAIIQPVDINDPPSLATLQAAVHRDLARSKHPRSYEFVAGPLRDAAGKLRRSALREQSIARLQPRSVSG
jgi:bile acid-coenzyme A ligase